MIVKCRLDSLLTENDVSIDELSLKTNISVSTINAILSGSHIPSVYLCFVLCAFFGISIYDLVYLDDDL